MDTKHIHCMLEKIAEYGKQMMEEAVGAGNVNLDDAGKIVDMVKDLAYAEKCARIAKCLRKEDEEEESEQKYLLKRLKEDYKDEYKQMQDEYGEDADRRFYDSWRRADGRFAEKGSGEYRPRSYYRRGGRGRGRRGYEEMMPMDYRMDIDDYKMYPAEYMRDLDRMTGRMYYSGGGSSGGNSGGQSGSSGMSGGSSGGSSGGNSGGSTRGYEEYQRGYSEGRAEGYNQGRNDGRNSQNRDYREGRSGTSRRSYMETKEMNKGNTPQEKQEKMKELEKYMKELAEDVTEMIEDATPEEKSLLKQKLQVLTQKVG